jgi:hypothetical protein
MAVDMSIPIPWVNVQPKPGTGAAGVLAAGNVASAAAQAATQPNNVNAQNQFNQVLQQNNNSVTTGQGSQPRGGGTYYTGSRGGGGSSGSSSSGSNAGVQSIPSQVNSQAVYDSSGDIKGIDTGHSSVVGLSSADIQRRNELKNAGFNENDISVLTSASGSRFTYYNGKVVPQSNSQKAFQAQANAQSKDTEKRFSDTAVAGGLTVFGIGLAPVAAAVGGGVGLAGVIGGNVLAGLGLIDSAKGVMGLQGTGTTRKITQEKQELTIREVENRINEKYAVDKSMNVPVLGDVPNIPIPFLGSTKNLAYGLPGSKLTSEVIQGVNKQDSGLQEFENIAKQVLVEQGYNERDAASNAKFLRGVSCGGDVGSVASLFPFGGIGEYGVRTGVQQSVKLSGVFASKEAAAEAAKTAAKNAATIPSIVEGVSMYVGQTRARSGEVKAEGVILSGGLSGLTGRTGAGWMAKNSILNPKFADAMYKGSWFLGQVDEPLGDAYTDLMMKAVSKPTDIKVKYFVPTMTLTPSGTEKINFPKDWSGGIYSNGGSSNVTGKGNSQAIIDLITGKGNSDTVSSSSQSQSKTEGDSSSIVNTVGDTWNQTFTNTYTDNSTQTQTNTFTNTATSTFTNTGNLPFLPMPGGLGLGNGEAFGGGGAGARGKRKYYDEWSAAYGIFTESQRFGNSVRTGNPFKTNKQLAKEYAYSQKKLSKDLFKESAAQRKQGVVPNFNPFNAFGFNQNQKTGSKFNPFDFSNVENIFSRKKRK